MSADIINFAPRVGRLPHDRPEDPAETYRCRICDGLVWSSEETDELMRTCIKDVCRYTRISQLLRYERAGERMAELLTMDRQYSITPQELHAQVVAVALAAEFTHARRKS